MQTQWWTARGRTETERSPRLQECNALLRVKGFGLLLGPAPVVRTACRLRYPGGLKAVIKGG